MNILRKNELLSEAVAAPQGNESYKWRGKGRGGERRGESGQEWDISEILCFFPQYVLNFKLYDENSEEAYNELKFCLLLQQWNFFVL